MAAVQPRTRSIPICLLFYTWLALSCMHFAAHAALRGEISTSESSAVASISVRIEPTIQITNVSDIDLTVTDRNSDIQVEERICIRGNLGSRYSVIAASQDGRENPFQLINENGDSVNYEVYFKHDLTNDVQDRLNPGESSRYYPMQMSEQNCNGDDTASFSIVIRSEQLLPAQPGLYAGFLTLTVAAE